MSRQKNSILINEHALNREPVPLISSVVDLSCSGYCFTVKISFINQIIQSFRIFETLYMLLLQQLPKLIGRLTSKL